MNEQLAVAYRAILARNRKQSHSFRPAVYRDGFKVSAGDKHWEIAEQMTEDLIKSLSKTCGYRRFYPGDLPRQTSLFSGGQ